MSAALQLVHCKPPEELRCEIIKGGMDGIAEFECGAPAQFRSILDGWLLCWECAESMPYLWPERID